MAIEIERKFLVTDFSWRDACAKSVRMRQGYFATTEKASIRVRISDDRAFLNFKSTDSLVEREEFEYEIPQTDAQRMLATMCIDQQIEKTRHYVTYAGNLWMIDEFHDLNAGLVVAEIEQLLTALQRRELLDDVLGNGEMDESLIPGDLGSMRGS